MLSLYKLTQNKNDDWNVFKGFVIAAKTEQQAKEITMQRTSNNENNVWVFDIKDIKCQYIGDYKFKTPKIILEDFNAG